MIKVRLIVTHSNGDQSAYAKWCRRGTAVKLVRQAVADGLRFSRRGSVWTLREKVPA